MCVCAAHPQPAWLTLTHQNHGTAATIRRQAGGCLYEPLLAAHTPPRSGKSTFHLDVLPTSRPLTAHLAAGLQRAEVGVPKRQLSCAEVWSRAWQARWYLSPVQAQSQLQRQTSSSRVAKVGRSRKPTTNLLNVEVTRKQARCQLARARCYRYKPSSGKLRVALLKLRHAGS